MNQKYTLLGDVETAPLEMFAEKPHLVPKLRQQFKKFRWNHSTQQLAESVFNGKWRKAPEGTSTHLGLVGTFGPLVKTGRVVMFKHKDEIWITMSALGSETNYKKSLRAFVIKPGKDVMDALRVRDKLL